MIIYDGDDFISCCFEYQYDTDPADHFRRMYFTDILKCLESANQFKNHYKEKITYLKIIEKERIVVDGYEYNL